MPYYYTYDPFGRLIRTQNPDGGETLITYSDVSDPNAFPRYIFTQVKESAASYIPTYAYFDGFDRQVQTSALGENNQSIITQTHYDCMGRVDLTTGPFFGSGVFGGPGSAYPQTPPAAGYPFTWTSLFDYRGRPVTIKSKHGDYQGEYITTSFAYSGFRITVTDPDSSIKREVKDYLGRIIRVREWLMDNGVMTITLTSYAYNAAGDLLKVTDNLGNITTLAYDTLGHKRDMDDPDMGHWTYNYDKNGNLTDQLDAKNQLIHFDYDALNRVTNKTYFINGQPSTVDSPVVNTYDNTTAGFNGIGKPYTSTKGNIIITSNKYDSMGRILTVIKKIDGVSYKTLTQYDLSGKVTKLTYPNNTDTTVVANEYYPGTNLLKQVVTNTVITALYTDYAPTGKIGQITYPNGIYTFYTYDAWSTKLFGIVTTNNPNNTDPTLDLQNREYTYSRAGDILQIQDNAKGITYDYTYDMLHRLISEELSGPNAPQATSMQTITLDYGSGTTPVHGPKTITLNGVSRTCSYDANGNMTVSPDFTTPANPLNRNITYDADNMPIQIAHANGTTVNFVYDSTTKRTKKLVAGGKTVLYIGDHFEVENNVAIKYIFGGNLRLAQIKGSLTSYFHKDHLGSTAAITDQNGAKIEGTQYEPFGSTRTHEGTDTSAYKFTDQELDNETNLYNYDARLYDPVLGMFVTPDSIVQNWYDPQNLNRYVYCRNNPLIYTDPTGRSIPELGPGDHRTVESIYKDIEKKIEHGRHFGNDEEVLGSHFQEQAKENLLAEAKFQLEKLDYDKNRVPCGCKFGEPITQIGTVSITKAMIARILASESLINAQKTGLPGVHNGPADAFRHCEWSCRMAQEIGAGSAKSVGNVHELCGNGPPGETSMDLNNNSVGIGLGQPGVDCYGACMDALNNGALQTSPGGVPPNIVY